jgi:hypothetical protein
MNKTQAPSKQVVDEEVIARAQRAMERASAKAMEDYKRFGIEPVIAEEKIESSAVKKVNALHTQ